jgi:hypothetical protein
MGLPSIFNLVNKFLTPSSQGATTVQRTGAEAEQKSATPLEHPVRETNLNELNLHQQKLHAPVEPESVQAAEAVVVSNDQQFSNKELLAMANKAAKEDPKFRAAMLEMAIPHDGIKIGISKETIQKVLTFIEPFLRDVKGNLDKLLSKPFDKPTTGIELMEKFFSIPLARKILDATGNYMGELSSKAAVLHPEQTQATAATPA